MSALPLVWWTYRVVHLTLRRAVVAGPADLAHAGPMLRLKNN